MQVVRTLGFIVLQDDYEQISVQFLGSSQRSGTYYLNHVFRLYGFLQIPIREPKNEFS
jgi:hypothetical protein